MYAYVWEFVHFFFFFDRWDPSKIKLNLGNGSYIITLNVEEEQGARWEAEWNSQRKVWEIPQTCASIHISLSCVCA